MAWYMNKISEYEIGYSKEAREWAKNLRGYCKRHACNDCTFGIENSGCELKCCPDEWGRTNELEVEHEK